MAANPIDAGMKAELSRWLEKCRVDPPDGPDTLPTPEDAPECESGQPETFYGDGPWFHPLEVYRPLPQALAFHRSRKRYRVSLGGNRSSKSLSLAAEVAMFGLACHPWRELNPPYDLWYCAPSWDMVGAILWPTLKPLLGPGPYSVRWHNRGRSIPHSITFTRDGAGNAMPPVTLYFKSYDQGREKFQGTAMRFIGNDEQMPGDILEEQMTRQSAEHPLDVVLNCTPIEMDVGLELQTTTEVPPAWDVFTFPLDDNRISRGGFIPDPSIDALIESWPEESRPTRRLGHWASHVGAVYQLFSRATHVIPEAAEQALLGAAKPHQIHPYTTVVAGVDWGASNPFACLWASRLKDNTWYVFDEYYWDPKAAGVRLISDHAKAILARYAAWGANLGRVWSDHAPQQQHELSAAGVPSMSAYKADELGSIAVMQKAMLVSPETGHPRFLVAARCENTIREIAGLHWPPGTKAKNPTESPVDKDNHTADAARYILASEAKYSGIGEIPKTIGEYRRQF